MSETFREHVQALAGDADASEAIAGWGEYFREYDIPEHKQIEEFDGILQARLLSGQVSIAPPTDAEKGTGTGTGGTR